MTPISETGAHRASPPGKLRLRLSRMRSLVRSHGNLIELQRKLKNQYGPGLVFTIHPDDLMYLWYSNGSAVGARTTYLKTGDKNMRELKTIMAQSGLAFSSNIRLLDFGCGYGRLTRFLVTRLRPSQITVSDIDRNAVDFVSSTFGVSGFYSVADAPQLEHAQTYDLILAISLFSHLPRVAWESWFAKLYGLLAPGGAFVFTTQGPTLFDALTPRAKLKAKTEASEDGFYFVLSNETAGRIDVADYGQTYVNHAWVAQTVKSHSPESYLGFYPKGMWGRQDVYVLRKNEIAGTTTTSPDN